MSGRAALLQRHCRPGAAALAPDAAAGLLALLPEWQMQQGRLVRRFAFPDYYRTIAFVNALAWLSHTEDHHPELTVTYNTCTVHYHTHAANAGQGGLSDNDFICAARASALCQGPDQGPAVQP